MFLFRFESLLNLRRRQRDDLSGELVQTHEAIASIDEQLRRMQWQRDQARAVAAERLASGHVTRRGPVTRLSVERMQNGARYDEHLVDGQTELRSAREQLEVELERRRTHVVEAEAEVKRLERLREKQAADHHRLQLQREQAVADELTGARMMRLRR